MMKIAFWGLGSIAKRHIVNLNDILKERKIDFQIDVYRHNVNIVEDDDIASIINGVFLEKEIQDRMYDIIFITNPTALHFNTIKKCNSHTKSMFIEKPVFDNCEANIGDLQLKDNSIYYVACPLRYTAVIQYVRQNVDLNKVYSVQAISSSYLPEWRPNTDYRKTYSAHKDMGGGVAIDLIHEWDYLTALFGFPERVSYYGGRYSDLEIDSDDLATYIGQYPNKLIELHLDYFGRKTIRQLILYTKEDTILADIAEGCVKYLRKGITIDLKENRDCYQKRELEHFMEIISKKCNNDNSIENAINVLKLTNTSV